MVRPPFLQEPDPAPCEGAPLQARTSRKDNTQPAGAPKPSRPGPGRPPGIPNRRPAPPYDVGKTVKRGRTLAALQQSGG